MSSKKIIYVGSLQKRMTKDFYSLFPFYHVSKGVKEQTFSQKLLWTEGSDPPPH